MITVKEIIDLAAGVYQGRSLRREADEQRLAEARVLLMRLISLNPNDPSTPIHTGNPHHASRALAEWEQAISDVRMQLENTALGIRSKKHRELAARILAIAEPPLGEWDDGAAVFLIGEIKAELAPEIVAARRDPHALTDED